MQRIAVESVEVFAGPAFEEPSEDGPQTVCNIYAWAILADGRQFCHFKPFRYRHLADELVNRIRAAGIIDPTYWTEQEPVTSLEERFAMYAEREQEVRWGVRAEAMMYDGIPYR